MPKVAWEFGNWKFHGSARYCASRGSTFRLVETRWYHEYVMPSLVLDGKGFLYVLSGAKPLFGGDMIEQEKQLISSLPKTYEPQAVEGKWYRVWQWVNQYKSRIQDQHRRLGASCDWSRERFTLDEGLSKAVREVFVRLYEEGLVYRGERIINWCPRCMSALSDLEVNHIDTPGTLTYVRYPLKPEIGDEHKPTEYISVATTRPETILGDTAVPVSPKDPRYKDRVRRMPILPVIGRAIPIIADEAVDPGFGTGAVKVTPAHDPTDFEIGIRHNLPRVQVIGFDAKMTGEAGPFAGQDRFEARKNLMDELNRLALVVRTREDVGPFR